MGRIRPTVRGRSEHQITNLPRYCLKLMATWIEMSMYGYRSTYHFIYIHIFFTSVPIYDTYIYVTDTGRNNPLLSSPNLSHIRNRASRASWLRSSVRLDDSPIPSGEMSHSGFIKFPLDPFLHRFSFQWFHHVSSISPRFRTWTDSPVVVDFPSGKAKKKTRQIQVPWYPSIYFHDPNQWLLSGQNLAKSQSQRWLFRYLYLYHLYLCTPLSLVASKHHPLDTIHANYHPISQKCPHYSYKSISIFTISPYNPNYLSQLSPL